MAAIKRSMFRRVLPCMALLVLSSIAAAQEGRGRSAAEKRNAAENKAEALQLSTYEVGDLVVQVPDYLFDGSGTSLASASNRGGGFGGGGGGFAGGAMGGAMGVGGMGMEGGTPFPGGSTNQITVDGLVNVIVSVVAPESWAQGGAGGQGRIQPLGSALVVSQTADVHRAIITLFDELRSGSATRRTVSLDARWLLLNSAELERLVPADDDGERQVDRGVLDEFTKRPTSLRGATKCFSGQAVYVISGTQRSFVSSYIPVVGSIEWPQPEALYALKVGQPPVVFTQFGDEGGGGGEMGAGRQSGVGYQPIITTPNFGATLEVRPTLSVNGADAVVDLRSTVTFPSPEQAPPDATGMSGMPQVDRVAIQMQKLSTTLRVKLGEPVLVGGMTYMAPATEAAAPGEGGEQRQLYLVIELR